MRRLFFYAHSHQVPTGGQFDTYSQVSLLNRSGFDAYVFHEAADYSLSWFPHDLRPLNHGDYVRRHDPERDITVLPEDLGERILEYPGRKVIFNKGIMSGFAALNGSGDASPLYLSPAILAVLTISDHDARHMQFAAPHVPSWRVLPDLRLHRLAWKPLRDKRRLIAVIPKAKGSLITLRHILATRAAQGLNRFGEFEWQLVGRATEQYYLATLEEALICLFLSEDEGLGRAPLEAMACGCVVAGYDGGPLTETLPADYRARHGDFVTLARLIESVMDDHVTGAATWQPIANRAREGVLAAFSAEAWQTSVTHAWTRICALS